ncbi:MAG: hypothetical protein HWD58_15235 [Bacteroidota bacterium]|nr:MAG: hypothetical protein HWD58_15235 [Bacteroidota bacterium]
MAFRNFLGSAKVVIFIKKRIFNGFFSYFVQNYEKCPAQNAPRRLLMGIHGVLGRAITLKEYPLTWYRTLFTALLLLIILYARNEFKNSGPSRSCVLLELAA